MLVNRLTSHDSVLQCATLEHYSTLWLVLVGRLVLGARQLLAMRLLGLLLGLLGLFAPAHAQQCELQDGIVRPPHVASHPY